MTDEAKELADRIRQRIEVFAPGGDNERLLKAAADEIEFLARENEELISIIREYYAWVMQLMEMLEAEEADDEDGRGC